MCVVDPSAAQQVVDIISNDFYCADKAGKTQLSSECQIKCLWAWREREASVRKLLNAEGVESIIQQVLT